MPSATLPNMTEPPAICCVSARQLQLIVTARADHEGSVLRRWPRVIDEAAGRRGTAISVARRRSRGVNLYVGQALR
jgi:hypothetical protein